MGSNEIMDFIRSHKWAIILAVAGFFFALLSIKYSFLKALFIYICIALGLGGGYYLDKKTHVREKFEDMFRDD
ncbi:MAG: DUF2273 domain-containing protein [Firmicutes bacterium]|nr:DUF2273 domain-containing protein [Bacillota bacterium]